MHYTNCLLLLNRLARIQHKTNRLLTTLLLLRTSTALPTMLLATTNILPRRGSSILATVAVSRLRTTAPATGRVSRAITHPSSRTQQRLPNRLLQIHPKISSNTAAPKERMPTLTVSSILAGSKATPFRPRRPTTTRRATLQRRRRATPWAAPHRTTAMRVPSKAIVGVSSSQLIYMHYFTALIEILFCICDVLIYLLIVLPPKRSPLHY